MFGCGMVWNVKWLPTHQRYASEILTFKFWFGIYLILVVHQSHLFSNIPCIVDVPFETMSASLKLNYNISSV